jgi:hypothetical protein
VGVLEVCLRERQVSLRHVQLRVPQEAHQLEAAHPGVQARAGEEVAEGVRAALLSLDPREPSQLPEHDPHAVRAQGRTPLRAAVADKERLLVPGSTAFLGQVELQVPADLHAQEHGPLLVPLFGDDQMILEDGAAGETDQVRYAQAGVG